MPSSAYMTLPGFGTEPGAERSTLVGQAFIRGDRSLKLSTKAAAFKRVSLLIGGGAKHIDWGARLPLGAGPGSVLSTSLRTIPLS